MSYIRHNLIILPWMKTIISLFLLHLLYPLEQYGIIAVIMIISLKILTLIGILITFISPLSVMFAVAFLCKPFFKLRKFLFMICLLISLTRMGVRIYHMLFGDL